MVGSSQKTSAGEQIGNGATELIQNFLQSHLRCRVEHVARIGAGMFSQAFSFQIDRMTLVVRLNRDGEDFQKDLLAFDRFSPQLPIPKIVEWGRFDRDRYFAISERCLGDTLNVIDEKNVRSLIPNLFENWDALRSIDATRYPGWGLTDPQGTGRSATWAEYLLSFYNQKFAFTWERLFDRTCMERGVYQTYFPILQQYLPLCQTAKHWVHGDFGFDNVIACGSTITGVLDWAELRLGDPIYDIAYLEFWSPHICYQHL